MEKDNSVFKKTAETTKENPVSKVISSHMATSPIVTAAQTSDDSAETKTKTFINNDGSTTTIETTFYKNGKTVYENSSDPIVETTKYSDGKIIEKIYSKDGSIDKIERITNGDSVYTTITNGLNNSDTKFKKTTKKINGRLIEKTYDETVNCTDNENQNAILNGYSVKIDEKGDEIKTKYTGGIYLENGGTVEKITKETYTNGKLIKQEDFINGIRKN